MLAYVDPIYESGAKEESQVNNVSQKLPSGFLLHEQCQLLPEGISWLHKHTQDYRLRV